MEQCLFCQIVNGDSKAQVVYEDESVIAFRDIRPQAPVHILVIPRKHISTLLDLEPADEQVVGHIIYVASRLAREHQVSENGFRIVVNSGPAAGQSVYHIHFHLLGGRRFVWPPG